MKGTEVILRTSLDAASTKAAKHPRTETLRYIPSVHEPLELLISRQDYEALAETIEILFDPASVARIREAVAKQGAA